MELDPVIVSSFLPPRRCYALDLTATLSSLITAGTLTGFDASGHIAEETKNARWVFSSIVHYHFYERSCSHSVVSGRGILSSAIATGVLGFITTILFLFCIPDLDTLFALDALQPFVQVYALALGKGPSIFMTIIAVLGLMMVRILFKGPHFTQILTRRRHRT